LPGWAAFAIRPSSEYLGFMIGPAGGNDASWDKAIKNYTICADEIGKGKLAPSICTDLYNIKAFPRLSYVPQLCTPPKSIHKAETHAIEVILHLPHNTFPRDVPFCCDKVGMRRFTPVTLMSEATLIRTALKTCTAWQDQFCQLEEIRKEYGPIGVLADKTKLRQSHRDSERWAYLRLRRQSSSRRQDSYRRQHPCRKHQEVQPPVCHPKTNCPQTPKHQLRRSHTSTHLQVYRPPGGRPFHPHQNGSRHCQRCQKQTSSDWPRHY
jgi:hypothetical protein